MKFEYSTLIRRPVEDVFAYVTCFQNDPTWSAIILEASKVGEGPLMVGTELQRVTRLLGRKVNSLFQVIEYVPGALICCKSFSGLARLYEFRRCQGAKDGTNFTLGIETFNCDFTDLPGLTLARIFQRQLEIDVCNLRDFLESSQF